jgi:malate synthase
MEAKPWPKGIEVLAPERDDVHEVLTPDALRFVRNLQDRLAAERLTLLEKREEAQRRIDDGTLPSFPSDLQGLASVSWKVASPPRDLRRRKVEITGPAGDRKMVINALNSGADVYLADFEDSLSPTLTELIQGQINLRDAVNGSLMFKSPEGKVYRLHDRVATLVVRPRGIHLLEEHVRVNGEPVSATVFDFGLFFYHNTRALRRKHSGPYFYIPKMENSLEARFWSRMFAMAEDYLVVPAGTIRATALIETLPAAFEMEKILYVLKDYVVGLNCGRWDYIFSYIKRLRNHPRFVLPERAEVTMDKDFMAAYVDLLVNTCHRRGAYAIGGMSAYIPVREDRRANELALQKVRADKIREVGLGHDGTWVAHPGLVRLAREVFDSGFKGPNQLDKLREDVDVSAEDLLRAPRGRITEAGVRTNVRVAVQYLAHWLAGRGCVPINHLMEDAATAEISRAQLWQWVRHGASLDDGKKVTMAMVSRIIAEEVAGLCASCRGHLPPIRLAGKILESVVDTAEFPEFLTIRAYPELLDLEMGAQPLEG